MRRFKFFLFTSLSSLLMSACSKDTSDAYTQNTDQMESKKRSPNVVIFYVDDLGYGDLSSYSPSAPQTPNVDALAHNGIRFTDAHSPAATCTPSRYSLLTGRYAFRNQARVLEGDAPLIIDHTKETLPKLFKRAGYKTAVVGKWHLGLGSGKVDWNKEIKPGPLELGFDYSFLMPATGDRVPTAYMENYRILGLDPADPLRVSYKEKIGQRPVGYEHPEQLRQGADRQHSESIINGISRIGYMAGGKSAEWVDEEFADVFTQKAIHFIQKTKNEPFFLYFPFHDIHVPRLPNKRFAGKSGMGPRGDAILQMDWMTGQIVDALKANKLLENTLIIFTSDNGPVLNDGYDDQAVELLGEHKPAGPFSGGKYSAFEGGTRVPFITYFKGRIQAGVSQALISQIDLYASFSELLGTPLQNNEASDSQNILPALLDAQAEGAPMILEEAYTLALRDKQWKYIAPNASQLNWLNDKGIDGGLRKEAQLYDLSSDPAEKNNLASLEIDRVRIFEEKLIEIQQAK